MQKALFFKILQQKYKFRNPKSILNYQPELLAELNINKADQKRAENYLQELDRLGVHYTYPAHADYPEAFYKMLEPPLFLEYNGTPVWKSHQCMSVVGSRHIHPLTQAWMLSELQAVLLKQEDICLVSGGAHGVDYLTHLISVKNKRPTLVVIPSGLQNIYPSEIKDLKNEILAHGGAFLTEFEQEQRALKSSFFFRNRLIAALSRLTLVTQAEIKSGTMLTVHHNLQMGRPIVTLPAHPELKMFSGNMKLIEEGAPFVTNSEDLLNFWDSENWHGLGLSLS